MKKRVADIVVETLIENNITQAFSVTGGGAMHLNNAFALRKDEINTVYNHHEQASAMAAESYAKLMGKMAAVCVTSGPGGLNTLNGVQGAWVDSVPMIVIAGHPRYDTTVEASGLDVRCIGVQENDIIPQVKNITKYAKLVKNPDSVKAEIEKAIYCSYEGRRGPVWVSIPLDVQGALIEEDDLEIFSPRQKELDFTRDDITELLIAVKQADRPCILTGSGIRASGSEEEYLKFIQKVKIPIVGGAFATDANCAEDPLFYGMSGSVGPRCGNFILQNADLIIALGNSLCSSQTGFNVSGFAPSARIFMVDATKDEAAKPGLHVDKLIHADLRDFFKAFDNICNELIYAPQEWLDYCNMADRRLPHYEVLDLIDINAGDERIHPAMFWQYFREKIEEDAVISMGNSSCIIGMLQEGIKKRNQRVLVNYHSGSMGIDLPYAIGASAAGDRHVYCVTGDGCIMMNLQELQTIKQNKWKIKIIIFSNDGYDNIRNTCNNYFGGLKNGCDEGSGLSMPDFKKIAEAFGFKYYAARKVSELQNAVDAMIAHDCECILEISERLDKERAPILKSQISADGKFTTPPLHIMSPLLSDEEINELMLDKKEI